MRRNASVIGWLVMSSACTGDAGGLSERQGNAFEFAYTYAGADLHLPQVCHKISPRATFKASWGGEGHQIAYAKSDCFYNLALTTGDASHCDSVTEAKSMFLSGAARTPDRCRADVGAKRRQYAVGGDVEWVLRFAGFTDRDLSDAFPGKWARLFHRAMDNGALSARAPRLPDFSVAAGPIPVGVSYAEMGCRSADSDAWYCYAHRCLARSDEERREACLEVARLLQVREAVRGEIPGDAQMVRQIGKIVAKYPELRPVSIP